MHTCRALVATCIDFRFQKAINRWIKEKWVEGDHDRVSLAGGVKNLEYLLKQIEISRCLHDIKEVILINHEDCGAYGDGQTKDTHRNDLRLAEEKILRLYPELKVALYYLTLDFKFEKIVK